jgi:hypothetical protein
MLSSSPSKIHEPRVTGVSPRPTTSDSARKLRNTRRPVGFQNSATVSDQRFQAAGSYSLMSPPRTGRRRILPRAGWGTGDPGRGGRSWRARCGRCVL